MNTDLLQKLVAELLETGIYKTTAQVVEEFRTENADCWEQLKKEGEMLYGTSCSSVQQPSTRISQILLSLPADLCLRRIENGEYFWSKPVA